MREKIVNINGVDYIVREDGKIFSTYCRNKNKEKPIRQFYNKDGYTCVKLGNTLLNKKNQKTFRVHRIVAKYFVDNPNKYPEVDHLDSNRANPSASNLEWVTHRENVIRSHKRGNCKSKVGSNNPKAKLTENDVLEIRRLYDNDIMCQAEIAKKYGRGWSTIHNIVNRFTWAHI